MKSFLILNGPNLNLLGIREPETYGSKTMKKIMNELKIFEKEKEILIEWFQSNHEGSMLDKIHDVLRNKVNGIIINPGAWGHQSIALRDALLSVNVPFIEVHLSNIYKREPFRKNSMLADRALAIITGCGSLGYQFAITTFLSNNLGES